MPMLPLCYWSSRLFICARRCQCYCVFIFLLYPFWNHLVIPTIWLALRSVIYSRITSFFVQNPICSKSRHFCSKPNHFSSIVISVSKTKWNLKAFLFPLFNKQATRSIKFGTDWILRFQNGCNKVVIELRVVQFWSEIKLVISMELALRVRFEIT